jgi:hypothetical protein
MEPQALWGKNYVNEESLITSLVSPKRSRSRHSHFYTGLYAYAWVNFVDTCADLVHALLQLSPEK